jgi:PmbA protein
MNLEEVAQRAVARAKKKGAQQADAFAEYGRKSSCRVRDGDIEDLTESASKGIGLRAFKGGRLGFAYTTDFSASSIDAMVDKALALAEAAAPNKSNGLPAKKNSLKVPDVGALFDREVAELPLDWKIKTALEMERAGKAVDGRITTFETVMVGDYVSEVFLASSEGLGHGHSGTYVYCYAAPIAESGEQKQTNSWMDYKRFLKDLEPPEEVAKKAAHRTLRMLGARKVKTQRVPVVFDPTMAASFVDNVAEAADGDLIFKKSSVLAALLNKRVGEGFLNIIDDGTLPRGLATSPIDGEGVPTRKTRIVEGGVLKSFLYDTFTARKAKAASTGNAVRSYRSLPSIGTNNLYLEAGTRSAEDIIREIPQGFYVTSMLGSGVNVVTGDYSRGANGLWIENGELTHPVQEVTVAGNLISMLKQLDAIGSDLEFRGTTGAPTIRFSELTVSGS